ncbi:hypothetical protein [Pseudobutyrivibrio xylanivorans]|uniref:Gram-positive pilin subunit D1 N-terminal domain-containing protein n=1 Tax=Pseudobutyrivibrio xylanivorans TaxID=185007 RepID=A0A1G5S608_PSEXY|nr:hypothetical protein [Pseudobutyrivibrio xylanivorans]SCZ80989.1 hypothetical protein SAMN02910350_02578 [Pseudobutyrivibrio xylanivorans]
MKFFDIKKNMVAFALAAVVAVGCADAIDVYAAEPVNTNATVNITAQVGKDDASVFAKSYTGTVDINLYKIAVLDETGKPQLSDSYQNCGIDITVLNNSPKVADIEKNIVEPAVQAANGKQPDAVITASRKDGSISGKVSIASGAGVYLYIPQPVSDEKYKYNFVPYIIFAPTSDYVASGVAGADETWKYDVSFIIKPQETPIIVEQPPHNPTTPHEDEIVEWGEEIIEMESPLVPLAGPKTGDSLIPMILCGLALLFGLGLMAWYFSLVAGNKKVVEE